MSQDRHVIADYATLSTWQLRKRLLLLAGAWGLSRSLFLLRKLLFFRIANKAIRDVRMRVIMQLHRTPLANQQDHAAMHVLTSLSRVSMTVRRFINTSFVALPRAWMRLFAVSASLGYLYPPALGFLAGTWLLLLYLLYSLGARLAARQHAWKASEQTMRQLDESLQNNKFARLQLQQEQRRLGKQFDREAYWWFQETWQKKKFYLVKNVLFFTMAGMLLWHAAPRMQQGALTAGQATALGSMVLLLQRKLTAIITRSRQLLISAVDMQYVLQLLELPDTMVRTSPSDAAQLVEKPTAWPNTAPVIALDRVSFTLPGHTAPLLHEISLRIPAGKKVGLMGPSGAGKTVLCHLISGLYRPTRGTVCLQGKDLAAWPPGALGQQLCLISQDAPLLSSSVADNLLAPRGEALHSLGYMAARLEEEVGDRGRKVSGGEKQRILISRGLAQRPAVLILDETLCALDAKSACKILRQVCLQVPTLLLVTHHQELFEGFDAVYRLEAGRLTLQEGLVASVSNKK